MSTDLKTSLFINRQLPEFIRDEYPVFETFLEAYYEFLEQGREQSGNFDLITESKKFRDIQDVDKSIDDFEIYFMETYASFFPEDIEVTKEFLIKNVRPLYLSKGTENSFKLLFRLLFNEDIKYSRPSENILKVSDGDWKVEKKFKTYKIIKTEYISNGSNKKFDLLYKIGYSDIEVYFDSVLQNSNLYYVELEKQKINFYTAPSNNVTITINYKNFENLNISLFKNRQIVGQTSEATLIVEKVLEETILGTKLLSFFFDDKKYIGNFRRAEDVIINTYNQYNQLVKVRLESISVLDTINVVDGGAGYNVGDQVTIVGGEIPAAAIVKEIGSIGNVISILVTNLGKDFLEVPDCNLNYKGSGNAILSGVLSDPIEILPGAYVSEKSLISTESIRVQSQNFYHNYSYAISTQIEFDRYKNIFKKIIHPSGFREYNIWNYKNLISNENVTYSTNLKFSISGTVNVSNNSIYVTGNGTDFVNVNVSVLNVGSNISIAGEVKTVQSIINSTNLSVNSVFTSNANSQEMIIITV